MRLLQFGLGILLAYWTIELGIYWLILSAARFSRAVSVPPPVSNLPHLVVVTACRDGAMIVPGFAETIAQQDYPAGLVQIFLIADHCVDETAAIARALGMTVLEREEGFAGKGNSLNELFSGLLRGGSFDFAVVLDIDDRLEPDFLRRAAAHYATGAPLFACATYARNPEDSLLAHIGHLIQGLLRLQQTGRAALGWGAGLYGSHGYALSREALERLGWRTTTGLVAEDMELRLRATLAGLTPRYAADLKVFNDVTTNAQAVREQRKRWNAIYPPLLTRYVEPLLRRGLSGDGRAWEALFGHLLLPSWANLFLSLLLAAGLTSALAAHVASFHPFAVLLEILLTMDLAYFVAAFSWMGVPLRWKELAGFAEHLGLRALALFESLLYIRQKDWGPAPHEEKK